MALYTIDGYLLTKAKEQLAEATFQRLWRQAVHIHHTCDKLLRSSPEHREEIVMTFTTAGISREFAESIARDLVFGQRLVAA